ncbi:TPA_asm: LPS O-antigen length regulator [Salmonella enterica subsp. salamae serovar 60:g,m,t:z6]|uniref:LPS O-antigen length regulator n=1 Tax=Salmonella enterica subsp. houtenae serovar 1,40:z4,z32:- TaxID=1967604 RepID=A0A730WL39_SALHO|nr:LPS O-antigen length regulator Wzz(fepE) [Salmonella enterica]HAC6698331.1 LPS O-antigen length regulator [Salmonella bongori serovar 66:z65:-]HAE2267126.1 LPS O-antigen length regulator [Salmonella enterica subsp. enterica serovar 1,9,12:-:-]HAE4189463.1 LPS O-antigen length regulator [Salmonella enterica subsp. houtenae serovar 1,40:z4,z32:-]HAE7513144.1 LPS O-antigen length regulator [Salmonella enterica subsp. salamae serovar 60:g,m,t:z6]HCM1943778.1 LPS O-antigen length regulator [Salm
MSSLNVKQEKNQSFAGYSLPPANSHEIDLFSLMDVLWQAKRRILATVFAFACVGLLLSFLLPQKWTSQAIVTPAESVQWQGLERTLTALRVLDMDVSVDRAGVFNLFIKKFSSLSLLEEYLRSSPYVMDQLKGAQIDEQELHRAIVALSEKMKAVDSNVGKKNETSLFTSWTLSFTAPTREEAQKVLAGYIQYISDIVVKETLENIRNQLEIKTRYEQEKLAMDRVRLKNQLDANIQRLHYSLEIANAAGIKKPVYSNGQAVKDDPDFSISLGADGISRKLEIEKGVTDMAEINGDLRNRQYHVEQLAAMNVSDVKFTPFKYQLSPSLPVKKDGPGKAIIIILAALIGGMMACGGVLLRHAMVSRKMENALAIDERLV